MDKRRWNVASFAHSPAKKLRKTGEQPAMSIPLPKMQRNDRHLDGHVSKLPFFAMMTLELCAGTAGYTAALRRAGFDALGVDHARNRHSVQAPCAMLDLSTECGQAIAWEVLNSGRLLYVHAAPPCGTASRAREKHIPRKSTKE